MHITYDRAAAAAVASRTDFADLTIDDLPDLADDFRILLCELNDEHVFTLAAVPATDVYLELAATVTPDGDSHVDLEIVLWRQSGERTAVAILRGGQYDDIAPSGDGSGEQLAVDVVAALVDLANTALEDLTQVIA